MIYYVRIQFPTMLYTANTLPLPTVFFSEESPGAVLQSRDGIGCVKESKSGKEDFQF